MISWRISDPEYTLLESIASRAVRMAGNFGIEYTMSAALMDLTACHANGNPLRLEQLLDADDANFSHDVFGIRAHLDRNSGKLLEHFIPRFSVQP